jgi:hypothetical protein
MAEISVNCVSVEESVMARFFAADELAVRVTRMLQDGMFEGMHHEWLQFLWPTVDAWLEHADTNWTQVSEDLVIEENEEECSS